ncbi:hypothetical protein F4808DRAFT_474686 [Astrocystis sublimbata]|nr:hypothetical protein F4808DRAFT_474686 [Astrocystis sublimbata]
MVKENAEFASHSRQAPHDERAVCVFAGAMSGIGARILQRMISVSYRSTVFYVLCSSSDALNLHRKKVLDLILNRGCKIVFVDADYSLISGMDRASDQISIGETKVDYLCMSTDDLPGDNSAITTSEGLEAPMAIWYYSRMRLLSNLLPLLCRSQAPRVLNILNDTFVQEPTSKESSGQEAVLQRTITMTNLFFKQLATGSRQVTFVLSPLPRTRLLNSNRTNLGALSKAWLTVRNTSSEILEEVFGSKADEILERHFYYLTTSTFGPGAFYVNETGDIAPSTHYDEPFWDSDENRPRLVWDFTYDIWQKVLAKHEDT